MPEPVMEGHGYYNSHSELQARSAETGDAVLRRALNTVAMPPTGTLIIADFGSSQGHNSMRQMGLALDLLTARAEKGRDIMVIHTDLPTSDFSSLFVLLESAADSYRRGRAHVFATAIGRSFYEQLLPARSLTFGWSAFAIHWMSGLPLAMRDQIWPRLASPEEDAALRAVSAADWRRFLTHRSAELMPGGALVLIIGAADETGATGLEPLMELADAVLRGLVSDGLLTQERYRAMTLPVRPRDRAEFLAPFEDGAMPDLRLEELVIAATPNPAMQRWRQSGDAPAFGRDLTGFFNAAFGPSLFGDDENPRDAFASRLSAAIAEAPAAVARELVTATLRVSRRS